MLWYPSVIHTGNMCTVAQKLNGAGCRKKSGAYSPDSVNDRLHILPKSHDHKVSQGKMATLSATYVDNDLKMVKTLDRLF